VTLTPARSSSLRRSPALSRYWIADHDRDPGGEQAKALAVGRVGSRPHVADLHCFGVILRRSVFTFDVEPASRCLRATRKPRSSVPHDLEPARHVLQHLGHALADPIFLFTGRPRSTPVTVSISIAGYSPAGWARRRGCSGHSPIRSALMSWPAA
jgi:hypothetical protein